MTIQPRKAPTSSNGRVPPEDIKPSLSNSDTQDPILQSNVFPANQGKASLPRMQYRGVMYQTPLSQSSRFKWFFDMPVRSKQLLGLISSEVIAVVGLVGVGSLLIIASGRSQLLNQAKSEVAVTEIEYNIKLDQVGILFQGQAENPTIVEAVRAYSEGRPLSPELRAQVKGILAGDIKAQQIEYATLVGTDTRIVVSANTDRTGEKFDPGGLVGTVLANPRQVETSAIVSWSELQKEGSPLPEGFANQDALIRYTVTPVREPGSNTVIGVLVSGEIVNGKLPIVQETLEVFDNGYSAIYMHQPDGKFTLSTGLDLGQESDLEQAEVNVPLPDSSLLKMAADAKGTPVTERIQIGDQTYTMAAQAILNFNNEPVGILVRGISEAALNQLIRDSLLFQLIIAAIVLLANAILASILGRTIANPLKRLQTAAQRFAEGDRQVRAEVFSKDEVGQLAYAFNDLAESIAISEETLQEQYRRQQVVTERARQLADLTNRMRQLFDRDQIFRVVVREVRDILATDRTVIFIFDDQWEGTIVAESVEPGWTPALGSKIHDPCFADRYVEQYRQGRTQAIENIYEAGLSECYITLIEPLQVKANLVTPIIVDEKLMGLLIVHQCSGPRTWQEHDINFCQQVAIQISYALEQAALFAQKEKARQEAEALSEEQRQQKEALQLQLVSLLSEVEGAARGDLTVRADVTAGEIGTVADFFNSIVESLRQIVMKVKFSAKQVNASLGENEEAIQRLAEEALQQAEQITCTLDSMQQMTRSIQMVAESASQAANVARTASKTAEAGGSAMDLTVQNILSLRETVGETAKKVKRLGESSQQISRVVSLINQIAMQTNLLAINAGIEAARAGEEGQGFAVVAEEVGELAARSAAATQEIEKIVENIQRETSQVVEAMEQSTAQVVEGTHRVEEAKQSLNQILDVSRQIDELVQAISTATVSQVETSGAVSELMKRIAEVSERTSDSSRQVSHALQQTVEVAKELQATVGQFEVGTEMRV